MGSATVLYLHGGGMVVGSVPIFDGPVSRYVARTGVPMLSVPYRRAPEVSSQPTTVASATAIVPAQRAPFASTRPNGYLFTRWIEAKSPLRG